MYTESKDYTIIIPPSKVTFKNWLGHSLSPDASFDFSNIPKELHETILIQIYNQWKYNRLPIYSYKKSNSLFRRFLKLIWIIKD